MAVAAPVTPQALLRAWVRELAETGDDLVLEDLVKVAKSQFGDDPKFVEALVETALPGMVEEAMVAALGYNRAMVRRGGWFGTVAAEEGAVADRLQRWYENGHNSTHMSLLRMRRPDLRHALGQRQTQVAGQLRAIGFLEALHDGLQNDDETIADRYSETELAEIMERFYGEGKK
jgi:hypothetical protein